jgi:hypothetical protein
LVPILFEVKFENSVEPGPGHLMGGQVQP